MTATEIKLCVPRLFANINNIRSDTGDLDTKKKHCASIFIL